MELNLAENILETDKEILFLDKDETLGEFVKDATGNSYSGMYPGTKEFLQEQKETGRDLYVATGAGEEGKKHLTSIEHLLKGYFGTTITRTDLIKPLYFLPDGTIRPIYEDYYIRSDRISERQKQGIEGWKKELIKKMHLLPEGSAEREEVRQEILDISNHWFRLINKKTKEPFDQTTAYLNPYNQINVKDIHLVRRIISPKKYGELKIIMICDESDSMIQKSDPLTPLVVVSDRVRSGEWNLVKLATDVLFEDKEKQPWQKFDELIKWASPGISNYMHLHIGGEIFKLGVRKADLDERIVSRIVLCP